MYCVQMRFLEKMLVVQVSKKKEECDSSLVICTALNNNKKNILCIL